MCGVKSEFLSVGNVDPKFKAKYGGDWFFIRINPLPKDHIKEVIYDIIHSNDIAINVFGRLEHSDSCDEKDHILHPRFSSIIPNLKDEEFLVAIMLPSNDPYISMGRLNDQILFVGIKPRITFKEFPTHPHINTFVKDRIPQNICYSTNHKIFGNTVSERLDNSIMQLSQWLLRHMIWKELGCRYDVNDWIGDQANLPQRHEVVSQLNPFGDCRCGSQEIYHMCCLPTDYFKLFSKKLSQKELTKLNSQFHSLEKFSDHFISSFIHYIQEKGDQ